jgi:hypothetical protein
MSEEQPPETWPNKAKALVESLWFPALFFVGFLVCYMIPFHAPEPHDVRVAVSGPVAAAQIQADLEEKAPGAFDITAVKTAGEAREKVESRDAVAAFSVKGDNAKLFVAKGNGSMLESTVSSVFSDVAEEQGADLQTVDLAPTPKGDAMGTSLFYLAMVWNIVPYVCVMMLLRATTLSRRAKLTTLVVAGAVMSVVGYMVGLALDVIPAEPLAMLYGFMLTQAVAWTIFGLVPFVRQYVVGFAITLFVLFSIPSSGGAIPYQMVPGFFRWLHPVMPLGNFIDAAHGLFYFGGTGMLRPTIVLLVWMAFGVALVGLGALLQKRKMKAAAETGDERSEAVEQSDETVVEDPVLEAPMPHAVQHSTRDGRAPMLQGQVVEPDGTPVVGAAVNISNQHGHRLVRTHTDASGWYAVTGLPEDFVNVLVTAPEQLPAVARVLPLSGHPQRQDFVMAGRHSAEPVHSV